MYADKALIKLKCVPFDSDDVIGLEIVFSALSCISELPPCSDSMLINALVTAKPLLHTKIPAAMRIRSLEHISRSSFDDSTSFSASAAIAALKWLKQ